MEKALHNNQMRDTNKVCKNDFFGVQKFKMFIFRDVVGCNAQKRLILFFQKSCDLIDDLIDPGRIRRGNGLLCKSPWKKKTMRKRRLHILPFFHSFPIEN